MKNEHRFVDFQKYCHKCEHKDVIQSEEPCNECLEHPVNYHSEKPVNYKEKNK